MKLSVSAYRAHSSAHKKILSNSYQTQLNYGSTSTAKLSAELFTMDPNKDSQQNTSLSTTNTTTTGTNVLSPAENALSPGGTGTVSIATSRDDEEDSSNQISSDSKSPGTRTKSNQRWMKLRTTVQISSAISAKKPPLKREDSFLKRFSTRQIPETQETVEDTGSEGAPGDPEKTTRARRRRYSKKTKTVVNPDENFYFYWLMVLTICVLYNLWTLIVRQSFPELQEIAKDFWFVCDCISDVVFILDVIVQLRTGYLEQGLMVYNGKKLAGHYLHSRAFLFDLAALIPLDILQIRFGSQPLLRFPRFLKVYRAVKYYYIVESRTVWPNLWRVVNLIHILLILAHWFGCFYYLLSEVEGFQGDWVYPYRPGDYATLTRKYLGSLYWSTLTLTTIGDLPTPETNAEYVFTIVSYLIGVFIFATIVGQVGNVITNRNANRLEFERLLDGAKTYMRHHKVPGGMKRRVLRWYDYSWSRGRIQGGGDINTALGLLPDKLKTELALHVNLSVLKKVTIFQECQPEFLHDLVLKMKAYIFTPGDSICRKGEVAREMFIIADGILEVLSETGKVLTTMKAGDFFGEIGILNLDGLNKRTADVRSVGYSELFSLSREDVLAAMKDYPEAQEILQTLGRKRLMEVRCVNKKHAKKAEAALAAAELANAAHNAPGDSSDSTSKRIVEKLRSDVKGLKNVLKKSGRGTTQRRSEESIELQPLHSGGLGFSLGKTSKNVLKRMPRVRSDDFSGDGDEINREPPKTPSPIGAGLPLLQRLRLLKEKQDREERAAKSNAPVISPTNSHVTKTISPQESIQEEPEAEVIGAGLPLFQRLKMLKAKEEKIEKENQAKLPILTNIIPPSTSTSFTSPASPTANKKPTSPTTIAPSLANLMPSLAAAAAKPQKVSFKDRIKNLQQESKQDKASCSSDTNDMKQQLLPSTPSSSSNSNNNNSSSSKSSKPSTAQTIKDIKEKLRSFGHLPKDEPLKPWSKLKLATVNAGGSYTSLNNSFNDEYSPYMHRVSTKRKFPSKPSRNSFPIVPSDLSIIPQQMIRSSSTSNNKILVQITNEQGQQQRLHHLHLQNQQVSVSDSEIRNVKAGPGMRKLKTKPKPFKLKPERKSYCSVDDLSPEYCGLPFVKKLKILNERQKLAELESAIQTRSLSLDCTETTLNPIDPLEPLTRSHSEASGIAGFPRIEPTATTHTFSSSPVVPVAPLNFPQCLRPPLSPESNETLERRQLKSILKKLSEDKLQIPQSLQDQQKEYDLRSQQPSNEGSPKDLKRLMRAQTMEGYVARHSKLMKSVTFNRNTLSSPPNSANICEAIENRSLFPLLSAQPVNNELLITTTTTTPTTTSSITSITSMAPTNVTDVLLPAATILEHSTNNNRSQQLEIKNPFQSEMEAPPSPPSSKITLISPKANQKKFLKGSIEEHEYFGEVLLGIKQVIQSHLVDISGRFHDKFTGLETEVHRRDEIIVQLQKRIVELEQTTNERPALEQRLSPGSGSNNSSNELPFMRGDSLDTIFASSPTSDTEVLKVKMRNRKRNSPRHRRMKNLSWGSSDQDSFEVQEFPRRRDFVISELTGNIITDSVIVDIESSASSGEFNSENEDFIEEETTEAQEENDDEENEDEDEDEDESGGEMRLHHNDWELQMLAAELEKRESKTELKSTESASDIDSDGLLRRRRKRSDTETDISETDSEMPRPRAASLDQHNLRRGKCRSVIAKAMSFDRDKDRL